MRGPQHCGHRFQQNLGFEVFIWTFFFFLGGGGGVCVCYVLQGNSYCKLSYQLLYVFFFFFWGGGDFIELSFCC